jgi:hypothetical protein
MKALRSILILMLVGGLMLASVGIVFGQSSTDGAPTSHPIVAVPIQWRAFFGNVTAVNGENITIATKNSGDVVIALKEMTRCKVLGDIGWIKLDEFTNRLGGNLSVLEGKRVAVLAINVQGSPGELTGDAVLFVVMEPLWVIHHTTGVVTAFTPGLGGDITIRGILGALHEFTIGNDTRYIPAGGNITVNQTFVTVVSRGKLNAQPVAKVIVIHNVIPKGWPKS